MHKIFGWKNHDKKNKKLSKIFFMDTVSLSIKNIFESFKYPGYYCDSCVKK